MILVNTDYITGKRAYHAWIGKKEAPSKAKILAGILPRALKPWLAVNSKAYTEMMDVARALATKRMAEEAEALGADAVVNIRYASSAIMAGAAK